ncbi:MAG TPA: omptin family outer membrane protease [Frankiaceae bacterium]|nr:omptin family outer membrane protease [Frankiaceae bacterium]
MSTIDRAIALAIAMLVGLTAAAHAAGPTTVTDGNLTVSASVGVVHLYADEYEFDFGGKVSQLYWTTEAAPALTTSMTVALPLGWDLAIDSMVSLHGASEMTDLDWDSTFHAGLGPDDWSDWSYHPQATMDGYYSLTAAVSHPVYDDGTWAFGAGAGLRYTDVTWTAWGGPYIYSDNAYKDSSGTFPADEPGIVYHMTVPVPFVSADAQYRSGPLTLSGSLDAGVALGARSVDHHVRRGFFVYSDLAPAPGIRVSGNLSYQLSPNLSLSSSVALDQMFFAPGEPDPVFVGTSPIPGAAFPADLMSATITGGLTAHF